MENITYSFKEVCEKTGYKSSVIRYYEKEFKLDIPRDTNGRRYFTQKNIDNLIFIKQLQDKGYSNTQIKRVLFDGSYSDFEEAAVTKDLLMADNINRTQPVNDDILKYIEEKFDKINSNLAELNQNVSSKERDVLISENLKLKMEIKQKSYELFELKEKLRYEKEKGRNSGLLGKIFKKKNKK